MKEAVARQSAETARAAAAASSAAAVADEVRLEQQRTSTAKASIERAAAEADAARARTAEAEMTAHVEAAMKASREKERMQSIAAENDLLRQREDYKQAGELRTLLAVEEARRVTAAVAASAEANSSVAVIRARVDAEAAAARANEDVAARAAAAREAATATRWALVLDKVGTGGLTLLREHLTSVVGAIAALLAAYWTAKEGAGLLRHQIALALGAPVLVRETSRIPPGPRAAAVAALRTLRASAARCRCRRGAAAAADDADGSGAANYFADLVLPPAGATALAKLAHGTTSARRLHAPLRSALFYGPPGTGKTSAALALARSCGLDYAVINGGDVAPLGPAAVPEMQRLFAWAAGSPRGLLLFIDEAEAFLGARTRSMAAAAAGSGAAAATTSATGVAGTLAALLAATGEPRADLMLVVATNRPADIDSAVIDRLDAAIAFPSPGGAARVAIGRLHFHAQIASRSQYAARATPAVPLPPGSDAPLDSEDALAWRVQGATAAATANPPRHRHHVGPPLITIAPDVTLTLLDALCGRCDGASGRQLAKVMVNVQATVYAAGRRPLPAADGSGGVGFVLTRELLDGVFAEEMVKWAERSGWAASGSAPAAPSPSRAVAAAAVLDAALMTPVALSHHTDAVGGVNTSPPQLPFAATAASPVAASPEQAGKAASAVTSSSSPDAAVAATAAAAIHTPAASAGRNLVQYTPLPTAASTPQVQPQQQPLSSPPSRGSARPVTQATAGTGRTLNASLAVTSAASRPAPTTSTSPKVPAAATSRGTTAAMTPRNATRAGPSLLELFPPPRITALGASPSPSDSSSAAANGGAPAMHAATVAAGAVTALGTKKAAEPPIAKVTSATVANTPASAVAQEAGVDVQSALVDVSSAAKDAASTSIVDSSDDHTIGTADGSADVGPALQSESTEAGWAPGWAVQQVTEVDLAWDFA